MKKTLLLTLATFVIGGLSLRADVAANYEKHCQKCHGADGKGDTKMGKKTGAKDMSAAEYWVKFDDARAFKNTKEGMKDGEKVLMKPSEGLTDAEIKELIEYCKKFKK